MKGPVIAVVGPTAAGKSGLSLALACDHEYGTAYCKQIATDPLSFGVQQFGS